MKKKEIKEAEKPEAPMEQAPQEAEPTEYAFFVGCTTQIKIPYVEKLARSIFDKLGTMLKDLDFTCCPTARIAKDVSIDSWLMVAGRNLAVAEKAGLPILSMCTGCTQTLMEARHMLEEKSKRDALNERLKELGLEYQGTVEIKFYAQLIYELKDSIEIKRKLPFTIATHSGCHILRPSSIMGFDDPENPTKLDELITLLGADTCDYPKKGMCCSFPIYETDPDAAKQMMKIKMSSINADYMAVLCPTCFEYYELRQKAVAEEMGFKPVPVLHYMMLLGLAMGYSAEDVGFPFLKHRDDKILNA